MVLLWVYNVPGSQSCRRVSWRLEIFMGRTRVPEFSVALWHGTIFFSWEAIRIVFRYGIFPLKYWGWDLTLTALWYCCRIYSRTIKRLRTYNDCTVVTRLTLSVILVNHKIQLLNMSSMVSMVNLHLLYLCVFGELYRRCFESFRNTGGYGRYWSWSWGGCEKVKMCLYGYLKVVILGKGKGNKLCYLELTKTNVLLLTFAALESCTSLLWAASVTHTLRLSCFGFPLICVDFVLQ